MFQHAKIKIDASVIQPPRGFEEYLVAFRDLGVVVVVEQKLVSAHFWRRRRRRSSAWGGKKVVESGLVDMIRVGTDVG